MLAATPNDWFEWTRGDTAATIRYGHKSKGEQDVIHTGKTARILFGNFVVC